MAKLTIPRAEYAVLNKIASLRDVDMSALTAALREVESKLVDLNLGKALANQVKSIPASDLRSFTKTLAALFSIKENRDITVEAIVADVKETIEIEKPKTFEFDKLPALLVKLRQLLEVGGGISVVAKSKSVVCGNERNYCGSRILSDLRPVFFDSPDQISAAALVHNLTIGYHTNGEHESFSVALNPTDLQNLKKTIERAETKAKALQAYVERTGIRYIEDTE